MSIHRTAPRRDANEREIIDALHAIGATVVQLSAKGCPDLLVGWRGRTFLIEVKMPKKRLTDDQVDWHAAWQGLTPLIVHSAEEALIVIGA